MDLFGRKRQGPRTHLKFGFPLGRTFARDQHPALTGINIADFVLANPPFYSKDWARFESDSRWKYEAAG